MHAAAKFCKGASIEMLLFFALIVTFLQFNGLISYNSISRIGLTANLVQHGRIDIDGYDKLTADKSFYNGKYYSDKAPGMSLLATPIAFAYTRFFTVTSDIDFSWTHAEPGQRHFLILMYLCAMSTSALLTAIAAAMLFNHVKWLSGSSSAGLLTSITYALGTPAWIWATIFFGHGAAGALLIMGFIIVDRMVSDAVPNSSGAALRRAAGAGAALGSAITVEFTAAIPAAIILAYLWLHKLKAKRVTLASIVSAARAPIQIGLYVSLCQIPLFAYQYAIFGNAFHFAYSDVVNDVHMKVGLFGIGAPNMQVLVSLIFGLYRGFLWLSPVLLFAFIALVANLFNNAQRLRMTAILLLTIYYLFMNAGYFAWDGGFSTGPRHLTPIYPFLALALGVWFCNTGSKARVAIYLMLALSICINLVCVSVNSIAGSQYSTPFTQMILPQFLSGELLQSTFYMLAGKKGLWPLTPLFVTWAVFGFLIWHKIRPELSGRRKSRGRRSCTFL